MIHEMVDTLNIFDRLTKAEIPEPAARELSRIFRETFGGMEQVLATKADLAAVRADLAAMESRIKAEIKADIIKWVAGMLVAQAALIAALVKIL
jgi:hypothetical protein